MRRQNPFRVKHSRIAKYIRNQRNEANVCSFCVQCEKLQLIIFRIQNPTCHVSLAALKHPTFRIHFRYSARSTSRIVEQKMTFATIPLVIPLD